MLTSLSQNASDVLACPPDSDQPEEFRAQPHQPQAGRLPLALGCRVCSNSAKDLGAGDRLHVEAVLNFIYLLFRILVHALLEL